MAAREGGEDDGSLVVTEDKADKVLEIISDLAAKWVLFAGQLGILQPRIQAIDRDTPPGDGHSMECLRTVLFDWVRGGGERYTYRVLADVLRGNVLCEDVLAAKISEFEEKLRGEQQELSAAQMMQSDIVEFSEKMSVSDLCHWLEGNGLEEEDCEIMRAKKISGLVFSKMQPEHVGRLGLSFAAQILVEDILKTKVVESFSQPPASFSAVGPAPSSGTRPTFVRLPNDPIWDTRPTFAFLQLIRWRSRNGQRGELRILRQLADKWDELALHLGLSGAEISIIRKNNIGDVASCIRDTLSKWLQNGSMLPNARQYPVSWRGLYNLAVDAQLVTNVATPLIDALSARESSVRRTL